MVAACVALLLAVPSSLIAGGNSGFLAGFDDDLPMQDGATATDLATRLGANAMELTLRWAPGETALSSGDATSLREAVEAANGMRVVLAVYGESGADAPEDASARSDYCAYVRSAVDSFGIDDVVIWNEPNKDLFWSDQANAPADYEALLAQCYDTLHADTPAVNVIGLALSSTATDGAAPGAFIRAVGSAYQASGRTTPIMDTVGFHPYPTSSSERPWAQHIDSNTIGEGDWNKLMENLSLAFSGTGQAVPGQGGVTIWYLEDGFQTTVPSSEASNYTGTENVATIPDFGGPPDVPPVSASSPAPDQATQISDALSLAACQPDVGAFFNFMLVDDPVLSGWQSGAYWADLTPKGSDSAFATTIAAATNGTLDCSLLKGGEPSADYTPPSTPTGLTYQVATSPLAVTLAWSAATDNSGQPPSYRVYRNGTLVGTTAATSWTNVSVADATTYSYTVRAIDAAGNLGSASGPVAVTTPDLTPPTQPSAPSAQVNTSPLSVTLSWQPSTDNVGVADYQVNRNGTLLATTSLTTYTDATVASGSAYDYSIVALDAAGNVSTAATVAAQTPTPSQPAAGGGGGGGGGGSASIAISVMPKGQTTSSGGTATFTITVTNTGSSYLFAAGVSSSVSGCSKTSGDIPDFGFYAPGVTDTYTCTVTGVSASFTNTATATAQDANANPISATDNGSVTVSSPSPTSSPTPTAAPTKPTESSKPTAPATLTVTLPKRTRLRGRKPKLPLDLKASKTTTVTITLLDARGHRVAHWIERLTAGKHDLALDLPPAARLPGDYGVKLTETGATGFRLYTTAFLS